MTSFAGQVFVLGFLELPDGNCVSFTQAIGSLEVSLCLGKGQLGFGPTVSLEWGNHPGHHIASGNMGPWKRYIICATDLNNTIHWGDDFNVSRRRRHYFTDSPGSTLNLADIG